MIIRLIKAKLGLVNCYELKFLGFSWYIKPWKWRLGVYRKNFPRQVVFTTEISDAEVKAIMDYRIGIKIHKYMKPYTYYTASHLAEYLEISETTVKNQLISSLDKYRKSYIITDQGDSVFLLNTRFSWFYDLWKTFCWFNCLKY